MYIPCWFCTTCLRQIKRQDVNKHKYDIEKLELCTIIIVPIRKIYHLTN